MITYQAPEEDSVNCNKNTGLDSDQAYRTLISREEKGGRVLFLGLLEAIKAVWPVVQKHADEIACDLPKPDWAARRFKV